MLEGKKKIVMSLSPSPYNSGGSRLVDDLVRIHQLVLHAKEVFRIDGDGQEARNEHVEKEPSVTTVLWISPRWNIHQGGDLRSNVYFLKIYDVSRFSWMNVSSSKPSCRHYESVVWGSFSVGAYVAFQPCG
ncbi:hypothetical protein YC2023_011098 [Brassica napus]